MAKSKWPLIKEHFDDIARMTKAGYLEKDIYRITGVSKTTWEKYKGERPELSELLKRSKEYPDGKVVDSLFKNATGYYYWTDEVRKVKDLDGNERLEVVTLKKWSPGQVAAQAIWLKNRRREDWTDNPLLMKLRREEFEHKKQMDERDNF